MKRFQLGGVHYPLIMRSIVLEVDNTPDPCEGSGSGLVSFDGPLVCLTFGGKSGDKHLDMVLTLVDDQSQPQPVEGATVSVDIRLDDDPFSSPTATTAADGTVAFPVKNATSGIYTVNVVSVDATPLIWNVSDNSMNKNRWDV